MSIAFFKKPVIHLTNVNFKIEFDIFTRGIYGTIVNYPKRQISVDNSNLMCYNIKAEFSILYFEV